MNEDARDLAEPTLDQIRREQSYLEADAKWIKSDERKQAVKSIVIFTGISVSVLLVVSGLTYFVSYVVTPKGSSAYGSDHSKFFMQNALIAAGLTAVLLVGIGYIYATTRYSISRRIFWQRHELATRREELERAEKEFVSGSDGSSLDLTSLWSLTHKRLDYYHDLATRQAETSFKHAQIAMAVGFTIIVVSIMVSFVPKSTAGSIVTGALGTVAAVLAGFIANTFLKSQETASSHLRAYFMQPLEFSRYLVAERLLDQLTTARRDDGILMIIQGISSGQVEATQTPQPSNPNLST